MEGLYIHAQTGGKKFSDGLDVAPVAWRQE